MVDYRVPEQGITSDLPVPGRALAIGAHPDDAEFGAGATLAKWAAAGTEATILVLTDGSKGSWDPSLSPSDLVRTRMNEQTQAAEALGVDSTLNLSYIDGELEYTMELRAEVCLWIRRLRPHVVLAHDPWRRYMLHPDHRATGWAAIDGVVAARDHLFFPEQLAGGLTHHRPRGRAAVGGGRTGSLRGRDRFRRSQGGRLTVALQPGHHHDGRCRRLGRDNRGIPPRDRRPRPGRRHRGRTFPRRGVQADHTLMGLAGDRLGDLRAIHPRATGRLLGAVDAALDEVDPRRLVRSALAPGEGGVLAGGHFIAARRVVVLAVGKAATGMSRGAADALGPLVSRGLAVADQTEEAPDWAELLVGGHPVPDEGSVRAAVRAIDLARGMRPDELLLALVSGGGSALLEAPAEGLSLDDIQDLNDQLIRSGAPIKTINRVRQAVSRVKAGRLAARCRSPVVTLVVSDVGDDPAVVASGPTVTAPPEPGSCGRNTRPVLHPGWRGGPGPACRCRRGRGVRCSARAGERSRPDPG